MSWASLCPWLLTELVEDAHQPDEVLVTSMHGDVMHIHNLTVAFGAFQTLVGTGAEWIGTV